jgi:hypothetical protein
MSLPDFLNAHLSPDTRYFTAGDLILGQGRLDEVPVNRSWGT